ncbi:TetR/AcrR family transcriptional regulator [Cohnella zeiphila]|uniref:TetR/AcrR family transcriptional regulator n=1 Tax=Cohnella zeiphila TaxID=2761120 RepID=A0A7X0SHI2_9BACL|nr:TetR/AcrR family transcriptional regulator [Cohnella zeiphila]MBB6730037.1 TetR/AcrR family transcriptional regulator [Cohnella zeiphila]
MNDRKQQIVEAALKCFSRKGFRATSIQEIVDELGMAKGSIYFYFKSKEDLLLSVIESFGERLMAEMAPLPEERPLPPRDQLRLQLKRHFETMAEQRDFPLMLMREPVSAEGSKPQIQMILRNMLRRHIRWIRDHIENIYGPESAPYWADGAALFRGMMMEYSRALLLGRAQIDTGRLASFLTERLDDIVAGMIRLQGRPVLTRLYSEEEGGPSDAEPRYEDQVRRATGELRRTIEQSLSEADEEDVTVERRRNDFLSALTLLETEFAKPEPDRILMGGMLAYMKELAVPSWEQPLERLRGCFQARTE